MKKYLLTATVMIGALLFAACGNTNKEADKKEDLTIVTTFYPMYDFTKEIFRQAVELGHTEYSEDRLTVLPVTTAEYGLSMQMFSCIIVQTWNFLWIR